MRTSTTRRGHMVSVTPTCVHRMFTRQDHMVRVSHPPVSTGCLQDKITWSECHTHQCPQDVYKTRSHGQSVTPTSVHRMFTRQDHMVRVSHPPVSTGCLQDKITWSECHTHQCPQDVYKTRSHGQSVTPTSVHRMFTRQDHMVRVSHPPVSTGCLQDKITWSECHTHQCPQDVYKTRSHGQSVTPTSVHRMFTRQDHMVRVSHPPVSTGCLQDKITWSECHTHQCPQDVYKTRSHGQSVTPTSVHRMFTRQDHMVRVSHPPVSTGCLQDKITWSECHTHQCPQDVYKTRSHGQSVTPTSVHRMFTRQDHMVRVSHPPVSTGCLQDKITWSECHTHQCPQDVYKKT